MISVFTTQPVQRIPGIRSYSYQLQAINNNRFVASVATNKPFMNGALLEMFQPLTGNDINGFRLNLMENKCVEAGWSKMCPFIF